MVQAPHPEFSLRTPAHLISTGFPSCVNPYRALQKRQWGDKAPGLASGCFGHSRAIPLKLRQTLTSGLHSPYRNQLLEPGLGWYPLGPFSPVSLSFIRLRKLESLPPESLTVPSTACPIPDGLTILPFVFPKTLKSSLTLPHPLRTRGHTSLPC